MKPQLLTFEETNSYCNDIDTLSDIKDYQTTGLSDLYKHNMKTKSNFMFKTSWYS